MRKFALAGTILVAAVGITSARAAPTSDMLVQPGRGIGKLRLGMTPAQVNAVLGPHTYVSKQRRLGFGQRYVELQWGYAEWTVGLQGRPGALRVVKVASMVRRERTRHGIGPGSTTRDILRAYPTAACSAWAGLGSNSSKERWVFLRHPTGVRTIFVIHFETTRGGRPPPGRVIEVKIQQPASGLAEQRHSCGPSWRRD